MRRGALPTRRRGRLFAISQAKREFPAAAMSRWRSNATWITSNTTSRASFRPFSSQKRVFRRSHVALEAQCDVDPAQHDVAGAQLTPKPQPYRLPLRCG